MCACVEDRLAAVIVADAVSPTQNVLERIITNKITGNRRAAPRQIRVTSDS